MEPAWRPLSTIWTASVPRYARTADRARVDLRVGGYAAGISELVNGKLDFN